MKTWVDKANRVRKLIVGFRIHVLMTNVTRLELRVTRALGRNTVAGAADQRIVEPAYSEIRSTTAAVRMTIYGRAASISTQRVTSV